MYMHMKEGEWFMEVKAKEEAPRLRPLTRVSGQPDVRVCGRRSCRTALLLLRGETAARNKMFL